MIFVTFIWDEYYKHPSFHKSVINVSNDYMISMIYSYDYIQIIILKFPLNHSASNEITY